MRIHFLGGADEIGASSMLVETAGRRLLIDCGVRQGVRARDPLPDLALTQAAGGVDAILVTHAHFDHTGALPVIHAAYPHAPVLMTEPTRHLVRLLLLDSIKIMGERAEHEGDVPLYPADAVDALLGRAQGCHFLEPEEPVPGIRVTFFPAGHILGAAAIGIESSDGRALISGDIAVADQLTVPGMIAPRFTADVLVMESTYGDRLHSSREAEERRLAQSVGDVVAGGGKVLIPAFAIGRAQEVVLILRNAMRHKRLPPFPIVVDGMVRSVCEIYSAHPEWLAPAIRRRIEKRGNPFWGEDEYVRPIVKPDERAAVISGPPCCIVASSGMLTGGPSSFYAAALARDPKNLIAITGYQDEESPGRKLLDLAEGSAKDLAVGAERVGVQCAVSKYNLSAHADSGEISGLVARLRPKDLILVHGEGESRKALAGKLAAGVRKDIHLPALGDAIELRYRRARARTVVEPIAALATGASGADAHGACTAQGREREAAEVSPDTDSTEAATRECADHGAASSGEALSLDGPDLLVALGRLLGKEPSRRSYSLHELATRCHGPGVTRDQREAVRLLLGTPESPVEPDGKRPFLFRKRAAGATASPDDTGGGVGGGGGADRDAAGRLEQNAAIAVAREVLGPQSGLTHIGASRESWGLLLSFEFPRVAATRHREAIAAIAERTGWAVAVDPETHQACLARRAIERSPGGWSSGRPPAIHREEWRVVVRTAPSIPIDPAIAAPAQRAFAEETGWSLQFEPDREPPRPVAPLLDADGRMEINQAYARIREAFEGLPHAPRKMGKKTDHEGVLIEVAFISPAVGRRYEDTLRALASRIGWRVAIFTRADQQAVIDAVRQALPPRWSVARGPGLDTGTGIARLVLTARPDADELAQVVARVREDTGFELTIEVRDSNQRR